MKIVCINKGKDKIGLNLFPGFVFDLNIKRIVHLPLDKNKPQRNYEQILDEQEIIETENRDFYLARVRAKTSIKIDLARVKREREQWRDDALTFY